MPQEWPKKWQKDKKKPKTKNKKQQQKNKSMSLIKQCKLLINLDPCVQVFLVFCVTEWELLLTCCALMYEKHVCDCCESETFFIGTSFFYLKRMANPGYSDLDIWQSVSQR